ncbi:MAG: MmcQ/YjbR family DNA-binding protein [Flavobacteriales bacterium]|nr:MmcQ/YjbR family DNA-binding protein [Flavobacteriales bacterium]
MHPEALRTFALGLPHVTEDLKWGQNLCFLVHNKIFLILSLDDIPPKVTFKSTPEEAQTLLERPGVRPAPYLGRYYWLSASCETVFSEKTWKELIQKSYELIARKKSRAKG